MISYMMKSNVHLNFLIYYVFHDVNTLGIHLPILEITEQELYKISINAKSERPRLTLTQKAERFHLANTSSSEFLTQLTNITLYEKHVCRKDNLYVLNSLYWDA